MIALVAALLLLTATLVFQIGERRARARRFNQLVLKPNCLLTRYPIAFLAGPRTIFRLFNHWNDVPLFLREHGYEVYVIEPSGRTSQERAASIKNSLTERCHIVADGSLERDLAGLADCAQAISLTLVRTSHRDRYSGAITAGDLRPKPYQVFEAAPLPGSGTRAMVKLILLSAHNFIVRSRTQFVHPFETAELGLDGFKSEQRFLDLAISLAERDVVGSD